MPRPTVLVATTNPAMAYALQESLKDTCKKHGLKLEVCPDGEESDVGIENGKKVGVRIYDSAEALFDALEKRDPMALADTLVILDVGARLTEAFEPKASDDDAWHVTQNRAGVAVELLLRFPQVFPVFLSPSVPVPVSGTGVIFPKDGETISEKALAVGNWGQFGVLCTLLGTRHKSKEKPDGTGCYLGQLFGALRQFVESCHGLKKQPTDSKVDCINQLFALQIPLHFVSPLDHGLGLESTLARFARGMRCWFDPTGLRTLVRNYFLGTLFGSTDDWEKTQSQREALLGRLGKVAIAVDEEREFAILNAYAAYKFGRRAWLVTTFAEFDDKPLWVWKEGKEDFDVVVLRDIDVRFSDIPDNNLWRLEPEIPRKQLTEIGSELWKKYAGNNGEEQRLGTDWQIRVVSSNQGIGAGELWCCSEERRLGEKGTVNNRKYLGLSKPISTLYELRKLLSRKRFCAGDVVSVVSKISPVKGESKGGHGAPYLNLAMAESLLLQTRRCGKSPIENLIGALMAGEAQELLLGMSRTTALEALLLQHKHEVMAEVEFPGVSHAIDIKHRQKDVEAVLRQYTHDNRSLPMKNMFLSQFWSELKVAYHNGEQFTAAEAANARSLVHGKWLCLKLPDHMELFALKDKISLCVKSAIVKVATSFLWWSVAAFFASWLFTLIYAWLNHLVRCDMLLQAWYRVVLAMVQMQFDESKGSDIINFVVYPAEDAPWWAHPLAIAHLGLSYVLFGILVSMIYRKVTRA